MGIDFSDLVLSPAMATFAKPVRITPVRSKPNAAPYDARGIWSVESTSILTEEGGVLSTVNLRFGIRIAEFDVPPVQGDWLTTQAQYLPLGYWQGQIDPTANIDFVFDNFTPDGQGGATTTLKRIVPAPI